MRTILEKLYRAKILTQAESYKLFSAIITGQLEATQLASVLIAMKIRGERSHEIAGAATALLANAHSFPRPDYIFADITGTGGDGSNSINISTASAFVAAACDLKIIKHGNRSISSKSGSSDLLAAFNIKLDFTAKEARQTLDELNICFLFAPQYHHGFRYVTSVRKTLNTSTIFNILGPLINPARPALAVIGVYSSRILLSVAQTLKLLGYQRAAVVHSGGMDEVALHSTTDVAELRDGKIISYQLTPKDFGLSYHPQEALVGGTPEENRDIMARLLQGEGQLAHEETVAANVALLLKIFGHENLCKNARRALEIIRKGCTYKHVLALAARG